MPTDPTSKLVGYSDRTFYRDVAHGCKFSAIAAGGSIYLIFLIAAADLRHELGEIPDDQIGKIVEVLRNPSSSE